VRAGSERGLSRLKANLAEKMGEIFSIGEKAMIALAELTTEETILPQIDSATPRDSGWYDCQVNTAPKISIKSYLTVRPRPSSAPRQVRKNETGKEKRRTGEGTRHATSSSPCSSPLSTSESLCSRRRCPPRI